MTLETIRSICRALPDVTEDIKWGADLVFSVGGKMFCVANTEEATSDFVQVYARRVRRAGRAAWIEAGALSGACDVGTGRIARRGARAGGARTPAAHVVRARAREAAEEQAVEEEPGEIEEGYSRPAISSRPCSSAPSSTLTDGADRLPSNVAVLCSTIRPSAVR